MIIIIKNINNNNIRFPLRFVIRISVPFFYIKNKSFQNQSKNFPNKKKNFHFDFHFQNKKFQKKKYFHLIFGMIQ